MRTLVVMSLVLLAACHAKADKEADSVSIGKTVTIDKDGKTTVTAAASGGGFKISTDDFKASLDIPGMKFGGDHLDIDGMKLLPGSEVHGMQVNAHDRGGEKRGTVTMSFVSPGTPDTVLAHAEAQARAQGWTVTRTATSLTGTKDDKTVAYVVVANGAKTSGTVTVVGDDS